MSVVSKDPCDPITAEQRDELCRRYPNVVRLDVAFRLAPNVETCADLLTGYQVDRALLDREALVWAHERRLVQLVRPIDLFDTGDEQEASP